MKLVKNDDSSRYEKEKDKEKLCLNTSHYTNNESENERKNERMKEEMK